MAEIETSAPPCPMPPNECERLRELYNLELINSGRIEQIDRICRLARDLFKVPVALVSVVDHDHIRFLSLSGIDFPPLPRNETFCAHAIMGDGPLIIDDAREHPIVKNSPFVVGWPHIRFYAGVPLQIRPGINIGTISIFDAEPRHLTDEQKANLVALSGMVVTEILSRHAARELKARETRLAQTARMAKIGGYEVKLPSGEFIWDDLLYSIFGFPPGQQPSAEFIINRYDPELRAGTRERLNDLFSRGTPHDVEMRGTRPNGEVFWVRALAEAEMNGNQVTRVLGVVQDITARKHTEERIHELAYRDQLTGLPNRPSFITSFNEAVADAATSGERVHLVKFNIDHFREVNDTLGHETGDTLLKMVATALRDSFGPVGGVARIGGDEFAAFVRGDYTADQVTTQCGEFSARARTQLSHEMAALPLAISAGIATFPDHGCNAETIIKNGKVALLRGKAQSRGAVVVFDPAMRREADEKNALMRRVRDGIANHEFILFYQPIIGLRGGKVSGLEALMRWRHPKRGILPPSEFMAAFDEPDLAVALGDVALDLAIAQMRAWLDAGVDFGSVAINLSTAQFRLGDLADRILGRLAAAGVPSQCLTLEVTENVYMAWGADVVAATVRKLHAAGVGIALDDFGTGYASLSHLRQFPIDKLKIDKSFVQSVESVAIVDAVINMGLSLGMQVVAEGVEKAEQVDLLRLKGCDYVQGYVFAKPLAPDQIAPYIADFAVNAPARRCSQRAAG